MLKICVLIGRTTIWTKINIRWTTHKVYIDKQEARLNTNNVDLIEFE